jgi:putative CocE/NonD family hydrolase
MSDQVAAIRVDHDVPARMRDGTVLRANVYRPLNDERHPVLLTRLPYNKDLPTATSVIDPVVAARRGYAVVVQDTRGRFASEGEWWPFVNEADDGADTIAWASEQPWSDGQVGMFGASYFGFTQWSAAAQQPPALKAMVPFITWADPLNGLSFRGGALELGGGVNWNLQMGIDVLIRRHRGDIGALITAVRGLVADIDALGTKGYWSLPLDSFAPLKRHDVAPSFFAMMERPRTQARSAQEAIVGRHERVTVPTFNIGGWYDIFTADTLSNYTRMRALGVRSKLLIGPWSHLTRLNPIGQRNFGFGAQTTFINLETDLGGLQLRWFDQWLRGIDNGILDEPAVRIFVMGINRWRDLPDWPPPATHTRFFLRSGGQLSLDAPRDEAPDVYESDPASPVPTVGGALLMSPEFPSGPWDQRDVEARDDVLTFTSEVLQADLEVTGDVRVELWAISSARDTDFVARLVDVLPDGRAFNLCDGIVRARYRDSADGAQASLIEPGRPYLYSIDLWATSNVFLAGHRVRVQVTSSCFPRWDRNPNTGHDFGVDDEMQVARQQILHDAEHPSHIVLPVAL